MVETELTNKGSLSKGFWRAALWNIGALAVAIPLSVVGVGVIVIFLPGLAQVAWLWPMHREFTKKGETETGKGIVLAGGITFLLNASCWGAGLYILASQYPGR